MNAIILAGGISNRIGFPKPFLLFDKEKTFIERLCNVYSEFGCKKIILVLNRDHSEMYYNTLSDSLTSAIEIIFNSNPEYGRFYSLKLGVKSCSQSDFCFIQNIDNPFTDILILKKLYDNKKENAFTAPVYQNRGGHPILLPRMILDLIKKETNHNVNIKDFLSKFDKISAEVKNDKVLVNINTRADYEKFFKNTV